MRRAGGRFRFLPPAIPRLMFRLSDLRPGDPSASPDAFNLPKPLRWALLVGGGLLLLWGLALVMPTAEPATSAEATAASAPALLSVGNLLAVLLLAGGGALALYLRRRAPENGGSDDAPLRALSTLPLAQGQQLRLVACGADVLLLGVTAQEITLLRRYDRAAFDAASAAASSADASDSGGDGAATAETPAPSLTDLVRHHASFASHA